MNIIESNKLIIINWEPNDYIDMYEFNSDEKVNLNAGCSVINDIETIKNNLNLMICNNLSFAIVLKEENKVIGTIGMDDIAPDKSLNHLNQRYIGYRLNSNYWDKGYATEATQYFIQYIFRTLNLDLIWSSHFDFNVKSKRVIEKCGFKYKFTINKTVKVLDNKNVDELFYSITKDEYYDIKYKI